MPTAFQEVAHKTLSVVGLSNTDPAKRKVTRSDIDWFFRHLIATTPGARDYDVYVAQAKITDLGWQLPGRRVYAERISLRLTELGIANKLGRDDFDIAETLENCVTIIWRKVDGAHQA